MPTAVLDDPYDVEARLAGIGLSSTHLEAAARAAHLERDGCTPNDAPFVPGFVAWARAVRVLREQLLPHFWDKDDTFNFPLTSNAATGVRIAVASGDDATGLRHLSPRTRSPKGAQTALAVAANEQLDLFNQPRVAAAATRNDLQTWFFLFHIAGDEIRAELSLPHVIENGWITFWKERIILSPIPLDGDLFGVLPSDPGPDFSVEIRRKA
jgi:hypothetical protein